jgi:putative peptidoglycan lipid II flippase
VIGAGILTSRLLGLLRDRTLAYFFGVGALADVFATALRGPNVLQNLLGEQALSAAFIPVYSRYVEDGRTADARRLAGGILGLLLAATAALTLLGVVLARPLVTILVPGYLGDAAAVAAGEAAVDRFELAVVAVRLLFPMAGFTVLAAWCLGILNSHRRFFLPYFAPAAWNAAIITAFVLAGVVLGWRGERLLVAGCVGALVGGVLQFSIQLPSALRLAGAPPLSLSPRAPGVRRVLANAGPVLAGRGVVQLSSWVDQFLASFLAVGALGALNWAQRLYSLPVGLFGVAVAAAELPELSRLDADSDREVSSRLERAWRQMLFLTVPSLAAFVVFGHLVVGAVYRTGAFGRADNWLVYLVLVGYSAGLLATVSSRLLQNAFFALGDTRTPARVALVRLIVSACAGTALMLWLDQRLLTALPGLASLGGSDLRLGALGLAIAAGGASWLELALLGHALGRRVRLPAPWRPAGVMLAVAGVATLPAAALWWLMAGWHPVPLTAVVLGLFGFFYLALARLLRIGEATLLFERLGLERPSGGGE